MSDNDSLQRFLFENASVRGELVHLNATWQEVLTRHNYPAAIQHVLGEMMAASALLVSTLKFDGSLIMQIQGKGPLTLAVTECTSNRTMRAIAHWNQEMLTDDLSSVVGEGVLAITIEPVSGKRYQGIVDLSSGDLATAIEDYMRRSQQLDTRLWLVADSEQASGMLLQKLPSDNNAKAPLAAEQDSDIWNRVVCLADTVKDEEIAQLPFQKIIHRLFHEEDVRVFESLPISFRCSCSKSRVCNTMKMLGYDEVSSLFEHQEKIEVNCEFCNHEYIFDKVDIEELFAVDVQPGGSKARH